MAGPWEKYQQQAPAQEGPWTRYASSGAGQEAPPLEIDIVGGTPVPAAEFEKDGGTSWLESQKRGLGLGARSALQGIAGLVGAAGGDAFNTYVMPGDQPSYRDAAGSIADRLGLPRPQTPGERVGSDVGEALSGTAMTMGAGGLAGLASRGAPGFSNRLSSLLTAQPGLQGVSAATGSAASGVIRESGGSEGAQMAAGLAGGLAPGAASASSAAALRGLVRGRDGGAMQQRIDDFAALGASPSVGQASGRRGLQGIENLLAGAPTSSGVMTRFAEQQADDIGQGLRARADAFSPNASGEVAGRAIERGARSFAGNVRATKRALYWQADQLVPQNTPVSLANTWQKVVDLTTPTPGAAATTGAMVNARVSQLRRTLEQDLAANGGTLSYEALKRIRTDIGEAISDYSLSPDTPTREYKALYAALSRDMEAAAAAQGPAAAAAAKRANNYTRAAANRMEAIDRVIDKNGGPEKVYSAVMSGTIDGATTLRAVMKSLPPEHQRQVTSAIIKRMGLATPGAQDATGQVFSSQTFLTNWNRLSPEAKRAAFDRHGERFTRDMDRIARVAGTIKDGSRVFQNPSGTANRAAAYTYGAALVGSLWTGGTGALITAGGVANAGARFMTNPRVVRWMARATEMPEAAIPGALNAMRAESERTGDEDLAELAEVLEHGVNEQRRAGQQR